MTDLSNQASEEKSKAYTEVVQLFNKISKWNSKVVYDDAVTVMIACQQLLLNYNEQCIEFIEDTDSTSSLLVYISTDGLIQWDLHKNFKETYGVSIY